MHRTGIYQNSIKGFNGARRQPSRLLAIVTLVVIVATSCGSETEQSGVVATTTEVETTTTTSDPTTTAEPVSVVEEETLPAPDAAMITFTEAFGLGDADLAWSFYSPRCQDAWPETLSFADNVADYAAKFPGATAVNISSVVEGNTAAISLDVHNGSGEYAESYISQPWIFSEGKWYRDAC